MCCSPFLHLCHLSSSSLSSWLTLWGRVVTGCLWWEGIRRGRVLILSQEGFLSSRNQSHKKKKNSFSSSFILLSFSSSSSSINRLEFNTGWAVFDISSAILCRMRLTQLEETIINFPSPVKANVTDIRDSLMSTMLTWHVQQTPGHASTCLHNFSHFSFFLQAK